jgi:ribosomal protein S18 acetylase RimI-like enzyme
MNDATIAHRPPSVEEYSYLREIAGWGVPEKEAAAISIEKALFSVCIERQNEIVGMGRIVGDGVLYFYVQDIIIKPEFRGCGYSRLILDEIMTFLKRKARKFSFIGLFAEKDVEGLYEKYGFIERPDANVGAGMFLPSDKLA